MQGEIVKAVLVILREMALFFCIVRSLFAFLHSENHGNPYNPQKGQCRVLPCERMSFYEQWPMPGTNSACAVIWDVDGTIVDTAELHYRAWCRLAEEKDLPFSRAAFEATFGRRNPDIIHELFGNDLSQQDVARLGDEKEEFYRQEAGKGVELLPGVRELLQDLHTAGFLQAVGSSAPRANLDLILDITGIHQFFPAVISSEDTTKGKPDPEVFLVAAGRLNIPPPRCLVMEDAVAGVQAAKAGAMKCIAVAFVGHHPLDKLQQAGADLVVENLRQVNVERIRQLMQEQ